MKMCLGEKCEIKNSCLRFKGKWNEYYQNIFTEIPFIIHEEKQFCPKFIKYNEEVEKNNKDNSSK
jgi:hypothetical protein